ncbi:hypothetical protein GTH32_03470 [Alteromonas sp. 345S023]|uniref:Chalcone isomerase domain-containing protein n=1 Tax=Alteromonas profundi TaxID=2696062 RepID=A0A7X5LJ48_9ALTE|nr:chalcone isomerase family protein [Alteromonas profundi]NDV90253.1 hypothetical protein [Alteromonas profundi]
MTRLIQYTVFLLAIISPSLFAQQSSTQSLSYVIDEVPNAKVVGKGMFTYYFWDVYEATLFAPNGKWQATPPFALQLRYQRALKGRKIAQRSVDEIRKQGIEDPERLAVWMEKMSKIFPDVDDGDTLTGIATKEKISVFYFNGEQVGKIDDTAFTTHFFNIWLGENTSEPDFRKTLLNH